MRYTLGNLALVAALMLTIAGCAQSAGEGGSQGSSDARKETGQQQQATKPPEEKQASDRSPEEAQRAPSEAKNASEAQKAPEPDKPRDPSEAEKAQAPEKKAPEPGPAYTIDKRLNLGPHYDEVFVVTNGPVSRDGLASIVEDVAKEDRTTVWFFESREAMQRDEVSAYADYATTARGMDFMEARGEPPHLKLDVY